MDGSEKEVGDSRVKGEVTHVRLLGQTPEETIIRRIGDRDLYLGNVLAADPEQHDMDFEYVLSATRDEQPLTTHHHPLNDGPGNEWRDFKEAVETARKLYRRDGSFLIHCKAGISRSTTLVATVLGAEENLKFGEALSIIQENRLFAVPNPPVHELGVIYLAAQS